MPLWAKVDKKNLFSNSNQLQFESICYHRLEKSSATKVIKIYESKPKNIKLKDN